MGIVLYALVLIFFMIPLSIRAFLSLKHGQVPLPHFQNNIVVSRIKTRRALGLLSPIVFWIFHSTYVVTALIDGAWIVALAAIVYMAVSSMLSTQINAKCIRHPRGRDPAGSGRVVALQS
jgi:hypothetical protein